MAALRAVRERLASGPIQVSVKDGKTGQSRTVTLGLEDFQGSLLRAPASWPAFVLSLYHRHYDDWAREVIERRQYISSPVLIIAPLIAAASRSPPAAANCCAPIQARSSSGRWDFDALMASTEAWPTPDVGDALRLPVTKPPGAGGLLPRRLGHIDAHRQHAGHPAASLIGKAVLCLHGASITREVLSSPRSPRCWSR